MSNQLIRAKDPRFGNRISAMLLGITLFRFTIRDVLWLTVAKTAAEQ